MVPEFQEEFARMAFATLRAILMLLMISILPGLIDTVFSMVRRVLVYVVSCRITIINLLQIAHAPEKNEAISTDKQSH